MLYLAYGSNIPSEDMLWRCPHAEPIGKVSLPGWRLAFSRVANIEKEEGSSVPALLWEVPASDWKALDIYEGYPRLYRRETIPFEWVEGIAGNAKPEGKQEAVVYIMNGNPKLARPWEGYYEVIEKGYLEFGLDLEVLEMALAESGSAGI